MSSQDDVRRIARSLPGVIESNEHFAFSVDVKGKAKGFAWVWKERIHPKKPRVPQPAVLAVRVADQSEKAALLDGDPDKFFTEPHYNGFPAVLVRLANVSEPELCRVLIEGWRCMAPKALVAAYDAEDAGAPPASTTEASSELNASARPAASKKRSASAKPSASAKRTPSTRPSPPTERTPPAKPSALNKSRASAMPRASARLAPVRSAASANPKAMSASQARGRTGAHSAASGRRTAAARSPVSQPRSQRATRKRGR